MQTPQGFPRGVLAEALARDFEGATDCASLAEHIGRTVTVVEGDAGNFKITTPEDLARAETPSCSSTTTAISRPTTSSSGRAG